MEEAIADSLFPAGVLSVKYGLADVPRAPIFENIVVTPRDEDNGQYYEQMRLKLSARLYPLTQQVIESGDSMFKGDYIQRAIGKLKEIRPESN